MQRVPDLMLANPLCCPLLARGSRWNPVNYDGASSSRCSVARRRGRSRRARSSLTRMRRIGVLTPFAADDAEGHARLTAFAQGLQQLGWTVGQNIRIDYRWGDGKPAQMRKLADELVSLAPDVILANSSAAVSPLLQATRTVPIVFAAVADPVGAGYVESLARPGGNATGFIVVRIQHQRQMAGAAQRDRAARDTGGGVARFRHRGRSRLFRRHSGRGVIARASSCARSMCEILARSNVPSWPSRRPQMAA